MSNLKSVYFRDNVIYTNKKYFQDKTDGASDFKLAKKEDDTIKPKDDIGLIIWDAYDDNNKALTEKVFAPDNCCIGIIEKKHEANVALLIKKDQAIYEIKPLETSPRSNGLL